ncbi:MAG: hypothetical protein IIW78_02880 [Clostridia bacterium]|nr:hypothetical protein [Clostridia bacterium]
MPELFIHAEDLCFTYDAEGPDAQPALKGITLDVYKGEYLAVLGHNGS